MIAQRFRSIGWVASCAGAALVCYLASQSVATERAALARVDREIAATSNEIRRLNTEIAARGRMGQIERWNHDVLALQAPAPGQFVENEVKLAALVGGKELPLDPAIVASKGALQTVAYEGQAAQTAQPAPEQPMLRPATFVRPKPIALETSVEPRLVKASLERERPLALDAGHADETPALRASRSSPGRAKEPASPAKALAMPAPRKADADARTTLAAAVADVRFAPAKVRPQRHEASLLPSDLGSLIAAEKKPGRPSRTAGKR